MTVTNRIYYGWWLVGVAVVCQFTFLSVGQVVVGVPLIHQIASVRRNERDCPAEEQVLKKVELFRSETTPT